MGLSSMLRSPKHEEEDEEQQVPDDTLLQQPQDTIDDIMEGLEGFLGIESYVVVDEDESEERFIGCWDHLMEWEEFAKEEGLSNDNNNVVVKTEHDSVGFWDEDEDKRLCLNLNLNYQEVMDAWSHRGSLWARHDHCSLSNAYYMGEVPVMEGERSNKREASVLRYKEKRQSRLFSKKIRYQVRKLNADKRPRLKGRFVKRGGSEIR